MASEQNPCNMKPGTCASCKKETDINTGYLCKPCAAERWKEYRKEKPFKSIWRNKRNHCQRQNIPFNLTEEYLEEIKEEFCPCFGFPLNYDGGKIRHDTASLDRIDPDGGYVKGNVQWVSTLYNQMKSNASVEELLTFARFIISTHQ